MAPYNYNNYYDPVGSQSSNQAQGYTYPRANTSSPYPGQQATSNYPSIYSQSHDTNYANQQYSANTQQATPAAASTNRNASTLSLLTNPTYNQNSTSSKNRSSGNVAPSYDTNTYYASAGFAALNDRNQSNNAPLYSTNTSASTFGRLTLPEQSQSQSSSNTFGNTQSYQTTASNASTQYRNAPFTAGSNHRNYKTAYNQTQDQTQPPQRYASPLHAVQAQQQQQHHGHNKQTSRSSNPQPQPQLSSAQSVQQQDNQYQRQPSASVEPSPTTVDPTQVYDFRAEQQRKAQAEAEKRKKREAETAARKVEEDARRQEEDRRVAEEAARKEEQEGVEREKREAEEKAKKAEEEATKKKVAQARKNEQRRKDREEKRKSQTAATALTQMASGSVADAALAGMPGVGDTSGPPANDEEAEMRAMFKKMREFNARNPDMLAKLWEEERRSHADTQSSPPQPPPKPAQAATAKRPAVKAGPATSAQQGQQGRPPKATPATVPPKAQVPVQKPAPSAQQANGALWPPDKKGSLAEAAAKWLNNLPQNRSLGQSVTREQVLKILDGNPAYVQLCESLEAIDIRFGRSDLAQELLKAVPEVRQQKPGPSTINGQATAAAAAGSPLAGEAQKQKGGRPRKDQPGNYSVSKPSQGTGPVSYQAPVFSLANAAREVNSIDTTGATLGAPSSLASAIASAQGPSDLQSPYFTDHPMVETDDQPVEIKGEEKPEEPPKPPADKEEAARKRTFGDLVDLTKDNDDSSDEGPPRKIQQPIAGPSTGAIKHQPPQPNGFSKPMSFQQSLSRTQPVPNPTPYQTPYGGAMQHNQPRPMMPPSSDLPSQLKPAGPTEEQKQQDRMRGKMLVEPIMRDRVARKSKYDSRTIARDVLLATGRHPDMRPLNAHLSSMQKLLADHGGAIDGAGNKSDLSTIKWDIIDPGEPAEDAKAKAKSAAERRQKAIASADDGDETEADDEGVGLPSRAEEALRKVRNGEELRKEDFTNMDPMVRKQIKNRLKIRKQSEKFRDSGNEETAQDSEGNYVSMHQQIRQLANPKRARGRPPKSATATSSARASPAVNTKTNNDILGSDLTPSKRRKASVSGSSPSMASGTPAVGYAAFRQVDENGNVIKKKGRPVGWRKSIHSREANGLEAAKSASVPKSGSRLRQSTGAAPMEKSVQPEYQVYRCRWSGCPAQLDNLERLKKHVVKLHGSQTADDRFECQWQPCLSQGKHVDTNGKSRASDGDFATFDDIEHWVKHVNKEHLDEVAWKLGDGPRGGSVSEFQTDSEAYLSDAFGREVTPLIVPRPEPDKRESPETKEQKELRQAAAELKKLTDQRRREGLTMGREGSQLVTDKRRRGFLDDEDFEDVIYDSD